MNVNAFKTFLKLSFVDITSVIQPYIIPFHIISVLIDNGTSKNCVTSFDIVAFGRGTKVIPVNWFSRSVNRETMLAIHARAWSITVSFSVHVSHILQSFSFVKRHWLVSVQHLLCKIVDSLSIKWYISNKNVSSQSTSQTQTSFCIQTSATSYKRQPRLFSVLTL